MFIKNSAIKYWNANLEGKKYTELNLTECIDRPISDRFCLRDGTVTFICADQADLLDYPMQLYTYGVGDKSYSKAEAGNGTAEVKMQGDLSFIASSYRLKRNEGIYVRLSIPAAAEKEMRVQAGVLIAEPACTERLDAGWELTSAPGYRALQLDILQDSFEISCVSQGLEPPARRLLQQGACDSQGGKFLWNRFGQDEESVSRHEYGACNVPVVFAQLAGGQAYEIWLHRGELIIGKCTGYVYFKPVDLSAYASCCSVMMMTQGKCELQYYDAVRCTWLPYTGQMALSCTTVRFRVFMESGSKIIKMAVVQ